MSLRLDQTELHLAHLADHRLIPCRIPDEFHVGFPDTRDAYDLCSASAAMVGPMPQPGAVRVIFTSTLAPCPSRGVTTQSYTSPRSTIFDRNLRVITGAELIPHGLLVHRNLGTGTGSSGFRRRLQPEGVGIL